MKWRVERSLTAAGGGYGPGWVAINLSTGMGAWLPTWDEAFTLAFERASIESVAVA